MRLAIISHTAHYKDFQGNYVGWGPTISEINHLAPHFDTIYHVAFLHSESPPPSALPYESQNIHFVPLQPIGGASFLEKLAILRHFPSILKTVSSVLQKVDAFQLRTPTGMGVLLIPYLSFFSKKRGWYKYAGNWNQDNPPIGYAMQRWMLKLQSRCVTINGNWEGQPKHCLTFENPCLTLEERKTGLQIIQKKNYKAPFSLCFVGRLEDEKGVQRILDALKIGNITKSISTVHFIGNGSKFHYYQQYAETHQLPGQCHGFLSRAAVFKIYTKCQFLLLPSTASEGFPKVIAEGMNFGCIPIVSEVSSISQYVTSYNGFIITPVSAEELSHNFGRIILKSSEDLKQMAMSGHETVEDFTFNHYTNRILQELLKT